MEERFVEEMFEPWMRGLVNKKVWIVDERFGEEMLGRGGIDWVVEKRFVEEML